MAKTVPLTFEEWLAVYESQDGWVITADMRAAWEAGFVAGRAKSGYVKVPADTFTHTSRLDVTASLDPTRGKISREERT